jgi:hypothetical protein
MHLFTKTGSGQTYEKSRKRVMRSFFEGMTGMKRLRTLTTWYVSIIIFVRTLVEAKHQPASKAAPRETTEVEAAEAAGAAAVRAN